MAAPEWWSPPLRPVASCDLATRAPAHRAGASPPVSRRCGTAPSVSWSAPTSSASDAQCRLLLRSLVSRYSPTPPRERRASLGPSARRALTTRGSACDASRRRCHAGHAGVYPGSCGPGYCDCGSGGGSKTWCGGESTADQRSACACLR